jgi:hypothetical protein
MTKPERIAQEGLPMKPENPAPEPAHVNYWSLSFERLAEHCGGVATSTSSGVSPELRAEAAILFQEWQEGLAMPAKAFDETSRRTTALAGLRKRTVEILIKLDSLS